MATITAMAAQVKENVARVDNDTINVQLCMERTFPAMEKDLEQREARLHSHA